MELLQQMLNSEIVEEILASSITVFVTVTTTAVCGKSSTLYKITTLYAANYHRSNIITISVCDKSPKPVNDCYYT